jgi:hypothetical protein
MSQRGCPGHRKLAVSRSAYTISGMESSTRPSQLKPNRLYVWGHGMVNKLKSLTRKRRKREASKKRRQALKQERGE